MRGKVKFFAEDKAWGKIEPDGGGELVFVHISALSADQPQVLVPGQVVEFDLAIQPDGRPKAEKVRSLGNEGAATSSAQFGNCFVVMPFGRTPEESRWFSGWYQLVIKEAVTAAGYEPVLAAAQERPNAINDEIRAHLAFDPMVVVDLGGVGPESDPNPNVMYELGIRHALNLPAVIMAWAGQRLPFDISNQRVIMERRDLIEVPMNRRKLTTFIREATAGNFYRPMDAVGRVGTLALAETAHPASVLGALVKEVRELKGRIATPKRFTAPSTVKQPSTIKQLLTKVERRQIREQALSKGWTERQWNRIMSAVVDPSSFDAGFDKSAVILDLAAKRFPILAPQSQVGPVDVAMERLDSADTPSPQSVADEPVVNETD
jgi:cold shock CspA family protein